MEEKQSKKRISKDKVLTIFLVSALVVTFTATIVALFLFSQQVNKSEIMSKNVNAKYDRWYVLITDKTEDAFWKSVYDSMVISGSQTGDYVEWMGKNLAGDYSINELMEIAINSDVDGIVLESTDDENIRIMINQARKKDIPVITVMEDVPQSNRKSFVGPSNYNLGTEYGNQILKAAKETRSGQILSDEENQDSVIDVLILLEQGVSSTAQNMIISGIKEALDNGSKSGMEIIVETATVRDDNLFVVEEDIREILRAEEESRPDVVVCLSELTTNNAYQVLVDEDMVGDVSIIGYFDSESILKAIKKGIIYASASIDTSQMGEYCIEALDEYITSGYVNEYYSTDFTMVTKANVGAFLKK